MPLPPLLALAAHPDDLEFACGAIIAKETALGRPVHFLLCSRGEAASHGTPAIRTREAKASAKILGAKLHFLPLDGDAQLQPTPKNALQIAAAIRKIKPAILLAPTPCENQHPDHIALSKIVRDAARLARYAGLNPRHFPAFRSLAPHAIDALLYYAITPDAEPKDIQPLLIDISDPKILQRWTAAMNAHKSQMKTRNYLDLQLTRARLLGLRAGNTGGGITHAQPLYPADPLLFPSLTPIQKSARAF